MDYIGYKLLCILSNIGLLSSRQGDILCSINLLITVRVNIFIATIKVILIRNSMGVLF